MAQDDLRLPSNIFQRCYTVVRWKSLVASDTDSHGLGGDEINGFSDAWIEALVIKLDLNSFQRRIKLFFRKEGLIIDQFGSNCMLIENLLKFSFYSIRGSFAWHKSLKKLRNLGMEEIGKGML